MSTIRQHLDNTTFMNNHQLSACCINRDQCHVTNINNAVSSVTLPWLLSITTDLILVENDCKRNRPSVS